MPVGKISARLGVLDNPTSRPFINAFKQAWSWQGDRGGAQWDTLVSGGYMTAGGQLISVAPNSGGFRTRMFFNMPAQAGGTGRWRMRWEGIATVDLYGVQNVTRPSANEINFDFVANGSSWVDVVVRTINPAGGQIRSFSVVHQDDIADFDAGEICRKQYLEEIKNYDTLRFDEWVGILRGENEGGLRITSWESRALPTDEIFHRFVPYEYMVELCKEVNSNMWVCLPTAATNDHMIEAAKLIKNLLPEPLKVYAEYSTKTWDFSGTPQAHYCAEKGREAFGTNTGSEFRNWYGMRSTQMAQFWRQVWGTDNRLQTVVQHQADWVGGEVDILEAPLWRERSNTRGLPVYVEPSSVIDVFTVHAQIDGGMAYGGRTNQIETWRTTLGRENAFSNLRDQLLRGTYWAADRTITALTPKWEHYVKVANSKGMTLASYEVGNHLNGIGGTAATRQFVHDFSVSPQMGEVYTTTFNRLREVGFSGPLCMSVECRLPDQNISHGLQRWLGDHNPAWTAVNALMEDKPDVVVPTPVDPTPVDPDPVEPEVPVEPETPFEEPEVPTPVEPTPVEDKEELSMADRQKLSETIAEIVESLNDLKEYLDKAVTEPETPVEPVEPPVEPETPPVVTPPTNPPVTPPVTNPQPVDTYPTLPSGFVKPANIALMSNNWKDGNLVLPTWSSGNPALVEMRDNGSAVLTARPINGTWNTGMMQIFKPRVGQGRWDAIFSVDKPSGVAAFFTYAEDGTEFDFELVKRPDGSLAWQLGLHMFNNGVRNNPPQSRTQFVPMSVAELAKPHKYSIIHSATSVQYLINDVKVGEYFPSDVPNAPWSTTARNEAFLGTWRHTGWSGWTSADYRNENQMTVYGVQVPGLPTT